MVPRRVSFAIAGEEERATGWVVRISVVGVDVESLQPPPVGSMVTIHVRFDDAGPELSLPGRVQWASPTCFGVQFGLLGARETHAVVEASRERAA